MRDVYDLGDRLLLVATDRISAFDWVMPNGIPDKGRVLTGLSAFWFARLKVPNHLISTEVDDAGLDLSPQERESLAGRSMLVRKARVVPFECVVRGYLSGSGWKEYRSSGTVCGITLPPGLVESDRIEPDFHAGHQGRDRARRERLVRDDGRRRRQGRRRDVTIDEPGGLSDRRGPRAGLRSDPGRHQVRMGV